MNAREIALKILSDIYYNKAYSNISINKYLKDYSGNESRFIREIVYGSLENFYYLEHILSKVSKIRKDRIHKDIYIILIMSIYQIYFMDRIPDRAAVNEAVEMAKKKGNKGSVGFVNGSLRNIVRNKVELANLKVDNDVDYLSIRYSHPSWLVDTWIKRFGYDFTKELLDANNQQADFNIRVNNLKISQENLMISLEKLGFKAIKSKKNKKFIRIENPTGILETDEFKEGYFSIQDESSGYVAAVVNPLQEDLVLDVCAAPGGKTLDMSERMGNKGLIIARDIHEHRLKLIEENMERLSISNVRLEKFDATKLDQNLIEKVDKCLVDAPCSGLGTLRRNPEIKLNISRDDIVSLNIIQKEILETAKLYIRPGGYLVYSTCTIMKEENEDIIEDFLGRNKEFKLISLGDEDYINLYPNLHATDGFFIAKMKRI